MKFSHKNKNILFCKKAFSDILESTISKMSCGASPHIPNPTHRNYGILYWYIIFHSLAKIGGMQELLTLNFFLHKRPLNPVQLSWGLPCSSKFSQRVLIVNNSTCSSKIRPSYKIIFDFCQSEISSSSLPPSQKNLREFTLLMKY